MGHGQEFALFSEGDGKPFKCFRQRNKDII